MIQIVFFCGESGCGKSHLQELLMKKHPDTYTRIISTTTRPPREGEVDGVNYHFLNSHAEFRRLLYGQEFVQTVKYGDNFYGTRKREYMQKQDVGIFVCTPEGINDTINSLKPTGLKFDFKIVYFMATKNLLEKHGIDKDRIARGNITENFTTRYYNDEFEGIPLIVLTADMVDETLDEYVHRLIGT